MVEQVSSLKTGVKYKDTPIGKIPVDWEVKRLIDTASNDKYSFTGGPFGSDLKENCYTDHGVRIIQLQNIGDGEFLDDYKIFTSEEKANQLKSCNIYPEDIIIAKMADPVARACIIPDIENRYLMASDGIRLSVNERENDVKFILYAINSTYFRKNAERHGTGTTRLRIGLTELKSLPIAIPSLKEQKKIAEILTSVDEAIEKTTQIIEKTKDLKKGLMQKLFTEGIGHTRFKETKVGRIPKRWDVIDIKTIVVMMTNGFVGTVTPHYSDKEDAIIYLQGFNVRENKIDLTGVRKVNRSFNKKQAKSILKKDDVLTVQSGHIGTSCVVPKELEGTNCHALIISRLKKNRMDSNFLAYYLNSPIGARRIKSITVGSTVLHINVKDFKEFKIPCPPMMEQKKIATILSEIDIEVENFLNNKKRLEILKKGLMHVLLTGKLRVAV